ncbi:oxygen-independent coproporphyrinogen-3 oxidase [Fusobacterium naviforme]|nr:oxygen-independent coproporphyrinogen-3 oxidase [Fusobacterium naviforme]STO27791.1 Oxygen-independent coproporphyrinogen-III oxidase 2 [Fusobacterium naviforme]
MRSAGEAVCVGRTPGAREAKDQEMISLILRDVPFEQDVRELFMAFYPGERYTHEADENAMISFTAEHSAEDAARYALTLAVRGKAESCFSSPCTADRRQTKDELKRALYRQLSEATGKKLPWGTLTGIRPTKLALTELRKGKSEEQVRQKLKEQYYLSDERNSLCVRTASHELQAMRGLNLETGWSLYIGIPFCPTTCLYCSFTSYPIGRWKKQTEAYVEALCKELQQVAEWMRGRPLETIYMGGGTPTSLEAPQLWNILSVVRERFDLSALKELTVEAGRPDSITEEKFRTLRECGVTRISINPQTMKQETLDLIGRRHSVQQFVDSFHMARALGFDNINTDLIVGLPNESADDVRRTMEGIQALAPDDVTIHSLALKRAARLNTRREDYAGVTYGNASDMVSLTSAYCECMGLSPYYLYRQKNMAGNLENVGWCRPGCEGLYNILIMEELHTIVGCGAGTTTRVVYPHEERYERAENVKDPGLYIERLPELLERKRALLAPAVPEEISVAL